MGGRSKVAVSYVWLGLLSRCYLRMSGVSQKYQQQVKTGRTLLPLIRFTPFYLFPFIFCLNDDKLTIKRSMNTRLLRSKWSSRFDC